MAAEKLVYTIKVNIDDAFKDSVSVEHVVTSLPPGGRYDSSTGEIFITDETPKGKHTLEWYSIVKKDADGSGEGVATDPGVVMDKQRFDIEVVPNEFDLVKNQTENLYVEFLGIDLCTGSCTKNDDYKTYEIIPDDEDTQHFNKLNNAYVLHQVEANEDLIRWEYTGCDYAVYYERHFDHVEGDGQNPTGLDCSCGDTGVVGYVRKADPAKGRPASLWAELHNMAGTSDGGYVYKMSYDGDSNQVGNLYYTEYELSHPIDDLRTGIFSGQNDFCNTTGKLNYQMVATGGTCNCSFDSCDGGIVAMGCDFNTPTSYPSCTITVSATDSATPSATASSSVTPSASVSVSPTVDVPAEPFALFGLPLCDVTAVPNYNGPVGNFAILMDSGQAKTTYEDLLGGKSTLKLDTGDGN